MVVAGLVYFDQPVQDLELEFGLQVPEPDFDLVDPELGFEQQDPEPDFVLQDFD